MLRKRNVRGASTKKEQYGIVKAFIEETKGYQKVYPLQFSLEIACHFLKSPFDITIAVDQLDRDKISIPRHFFHGKSEHGRIRTHMVTVEFNKMNDLNPLLDVMKKCQLVDQTRSKIEICDLETQAKSIIENHLD